MKSPQERLIDSAATARGSHGADRIITDMRIRTISKGPRAPAAVVSLELQTGAQEQTQTLSTGPSARRSEAIQSTSLAYSDWDIGLGRAGGAAECLARRRFRLAYVNVPDSAQAGEQAVGRRATTQLDPGECSSARRSIVSIRAARQVDVRDRKR
jgi:hypothetical protein